MVKKNRQDKVYWVNINDLSHFYFERKDSSKQIAKAVRQHRERGKCRVEPVYLRNFAVGESRKLELVKMESYNVILQVSFFFFFP